MLKRLHRTRRRFARATLAGFGLFWALTAVAPCVMAAPCTDTGMDMAAHCMHAGDHGASRQPCHPVAKTDCQNVDQTRVDKSAPADALIQYTPVVLATLPVATRLPGARPALQWRRTTAAIPRPPLNLKHAILLI